MNYKGKHKKVSFNKYELPCEAFFPDNHSKVKGIVLYGEPISYDYPTSYTRRLYIWWKDKKGFEYIDKKDMKWIRYNEGTNSALLTLETSDIQYEEEIKSKERDIEDFKNQIEDLNSAISKTENEIKKFKEAISIIRG
jgi:hypothetical protein